MRYYAKLKKMVPCNFLIVQVSPGSSGRAWCKQCNQAARERITFEFSVPEDYQPSQTKPKLIRVQRAEPVAS
jgi:hypothetical protein